MIRNYILVLTVLSSVACKGLNEKDVMHVDELLYSLKHAFTLSPKNTSTQTWMLQYVKEDTSESLFYGDIKNKDRIMVFSTKSGKLIKTMVFEKEGPEGTGGGFNGFHYHAKDSLFLVNSYAKKLYLYDGERKKKKEFNLAAGLEGNHQILPFITGNSIMGMVDNELFFYGTPEIPSNSKDYHNKVKLAQKINLSNGKNETGIQYPEMYHNHFWPGSVIINTPAILSEGRIYQNFPLSDEVYVYDRDFKIIETIELGYTRKRKTENMDAQPGERDNEPGYLNFWSSGYYDQILIDPKNRILYRFFIHVPGYGENLKGFQQVKENAITGVVIHDLKKKKRVGEIYFKQEELDQFPMFFVGEDGLYLSKQDRNDAKVHFYLLQFPD